MTTLKIAVATSDGENIDQHFGHAETLTVYEVDNAGTVVGTETRKGLGSCVCNDDSGHDEESMAIVFSSLSDCKYVLVKRIGHHMVRELNNNGITAFELLGDIKPAIDKIVQYERKQAARFAERQRDAAPI